VFNSALVRHGGKTVALLRVERRDGAQSIRYAESADGLNFQVGDEVLLQPTAEPDNRNIGLFPEKIKGLYCRLDRPYGGPFGPQQRGASG